MSGAENLLFAIILVYFAVMIVPLTLKLIGFGFIADPLIRLINGIALSPLWLARNLIRAIWRVNHHSPLGAPASFAAHSPSSTTESGWYLLHRQRRRALHLAGPYRQPVRDRPAICLLTVRYPRRLDAAASDWYWVTAPEQPGGPLILTPLVSTVERYDARH